MRVLGEELGVYVQGSHGGAMARDLLNQFHVCTGAHSQRDRSSPQVMKHDVREVRGHRLTTLHGRMENAASKVRAPQLST